MLFRLPRVVLVASIALWVTLVAFGNLSDYPTNLEFVRHVLGMDTIRPEARVHYRAIGLPVLQHAIYGLIILAELAVAGLAWAGARAMWRARHAGSREFRGAMRLAVLALTLGLALWLGGFMAIGGEWFVMWMSSEWNALESAFRFVVVLLIALVFLALPEQDGD